MRLLRSIPSGLMTEWMAFDEIEPISLGFHVDLAGANVTSTLAEVYRDRKRRSERYKIADFMPKFAVRKKRQTAKDVYGMFRDWATIAGGKLNRKGPMGTSDTKDTKKT